MENREDRLEEIKNMYERFGVGLDDIDSLWLIKEVERLRAERADVIEELVRRYGGMFASPASELSITDVFREAQQLAQRRVRRMRNDV